MAASRLGFGPGLVGGVELVGFVFAGLLFVGAGGVVFAEGRHCVGEAGSVGGCALGRKPFLESWDKSEMWL